MTTERAIEILEIGSMIPGGPHSYVQADEACRMGVNALKQCEERKQEFDICNQALECWGAEKQVLIAVEELAELQKALLKFLRYKDSPKRRSDVLEEMADVQIVVRQLEILFGDCRNEKQFKLQRLKKRAAGEMPGQMPYRCTVEGHLSQMPCYGHDEIRCAICEKGKPMNE